MELEEYFIYSVYSTSESGITGIVVIDLDDFGLLFRNRMISVPFDLGLVEFGIYIPGIPLPEKSQKECGLKVDRESCYCAFLLRIKIIQIALLLLLGYSPAFSFMS